MAVKPSTAAPLLIRSPPKGYVWALKPPQKNVKVTCKVQPDLLQPIAVLTLQLQLMTLHSCLLTVIMNALSLLGVGCIYICTTRGMLEWETDLTRYALHPGQQAPQTPAWYSRRAKTHPWMILSPLNQMVVDTL